MATDSLKVLHCTLIDPQRTASDIMALLGRMGASNISMALDNGEISGMSFEVTLGGRHLKYKMPVKWDHICKIMTKEFEDHQRKPRSRTVYGEAKEKRLSEIRNQAKRTAWRLAYEMLRVQMAFVENQIKHPAEIFLPDMIIPDGEGETVGQKFLSGKALPALTGADRSGL
jgi:hypothetical protein